MSSINNNEQIILEKINKLNETSQEKFEECKKNFLEECKIIENKKNLFFIKQDEFFNIYNTDKEFLIAEKDEEIDHIKENANNKIKALENTKNKKNRLLERQIKRINALYNEFLNDSLTLYDENNCRLSEKKASIKAKIDYIDNNIINKNSYEIKQKLELINQATEHNLSILKENKQIFLDKTMKTNNSVKKIQKDFIRREERLVKEFEYNIYQLNEKIKEIQNKAIEDQKPFLNTFKEEFEKCDNDMHNEKHIFSNELEKIETQYIPKLNILLQNIHFYEDNNKNNSTSSLEFETYQQNKIQIQALQNEAIELEYQLQISHNKNVDALHKIQKESENTKNKNINIVKTYSNYELINIQDQIKYQNQLFNLQKNILRLEEKIEINKLELELELDDLKRKNDDNIATSNYNEFRNDYTIKINQLKLENAYLLDLDTAKKNNHLFKNKIYFKSNEALTNLIIEKKKIETYYEIKGIKNLIKLNEALFNKNKTLYELRSSIRIAKLNYQKIDIEQDFELKLDDINKRKSIYEANCNFELSQLRLDYANTQNKLSSSVHIETAQMENEVFIRSMNSLNKMINGINNDLKESLFTNYKTFGLNKVEKMIEKSSKDKIKFVKDYFHGIENIINKKIDDIASFKYNTLKKENIDAKNDLICKTEEKILLNKNQIIEINSAIEDIETQIIYLEIDNSTTISRRNFLQKELIISKKEKEFNQERLVSRYTSEINSLSEIIEKNNEDIDNLKSIQNTNKINVEKLEKEIKKLNLNQENKTYTLDKKLKQIEKNKIKEAFIYYNTIEKMNNVNKNFNLINQDFKENIFLVLNKDVPTKNHIFEVIDNNINKTNQLTLKMEKILSLLYKNILLDQENINIRGKKRLHNLAKKAKITLSEKTKFEEISFSQQKKKCFKIKHGLLKKFENRRSNYLNEMIENKKEFDSLAKKIHMDLSRFDIDFKYSYKSMNLNINNIKKDLLFKMKENSNKNKEDLSLKKNQYTTRKLELEAELENNAKRSEQELFNINTKNDELINQASLHNVSLLNDLKTLINESNEQINQSKKTYESAKQEIEVEKLQFEQDYNAVPPRLLKLHSYFYEKYLIVQNRKIHKKIKKKWQSIK